MDLCQGTVILNTLENVFCITLTTIYKKQNQLQMMKQKWRKYEENSSSYI